MKLISNILITHKSSLFSILSLGFKFFTGPLAIILIASRFTVIEQSIYYTFISISSIQWVLEMGVSTCLIQFMAAEKDKKSTYSKIAFVFYLVISLLLYIVFFFYSKWVFSNTDSQIWSHPWALFSIGVCINVFSTFIYIIEEGGGGYEKVYFAKFISAILYSISLLLALFAGFKLYSLGIAQFFLFATPMFIFRSNIYGYYYSFITSEEANVKNIIKGIVKFQLKLSLVWITGYLYWNFFTIYFYKFVSVDLAGKYGASNTIFGAISLAMLSILQTKRSLLGNLISKNALLEVRKIVSQCVFLSVAGFFLGCMAIISIIWLWPNTLFSRFLSLDSLMALVVFRFFIHLQELILIYLRMYKDEPLYILTVFNYLITPCLVVVLIDILSLTNFFYVMAFVQFLFLILYRIKMKSYIQEKYQNDIL
ncbi:oligosaccharide flippase family protein [Citrobacter sp. Cu231]|uniref:oligosaccharide flippase family protein n=1 Tax=Citrobacter sp. Cu231 TaxID=2985159 RepID=UPI002578BF38|nr:oligosaccharide flippase family protein [Citrobacter sp. Cu231]MDM2744844.1 oligosaccharide flippase family protein [Citrobacter sp. Cu231]